MSGLRRPRKLVSNFPVLKDHFFQQEALTDRLTGLPKAEYAVGYFTEMGIGCRRDPLEANVWYVRAADQGDERAKHRIAAIRAAASGGAPPAAKQRVPERNPKAKPGREDEEKSKPKRFGLF